MESLASSSAASSHARHGHASTSAPRLAAAPERQQQRGRSRRLQPCRAGVELQELLVGGAVAGAVAAALALGLRGEEEVCPSCAGSGGVRCFACEGSGKMAGGASAEALMQQTQQQRDPLGRSSKPRECIACKGAGMLFCKNCSGSGYARRR